jgi:hypothetical protein
LIRHHSFQFQWYHGSEAAYLPSKEMNESLCPQRNYSRQPRVIAIWNQSQYPRYTMMLVFWLRFLW